MASEADMWRLDAVRNTGRLIEAAMDQMCDANAAYYLVHVVMLNAMRRLDAPVARRDLDTALGRALRDHERHNRGVL